MDMNIERNSIKLPVGLDDSDFISYTYALDQNSLIFIIQAWDSHVLTITFRDVIHFIDKGTHWTCLLCELTSQSENLKEALNTTYLEVPENHPYKVYQFLDLYDEPSFEVICEKFEINVGDRSPSLLDL